MELLQGILGLYAQRADWFAGLLLAHIGLALTAIAMSGMIGLLTGIWIAEHPRFAPPVMGVCNVLYTIPAISLLGILIPFSGIGNKTAVIALTVYGIMPMVHNTYVGLTTLDPDILEAARGMGSTGTQALFRVKLPMAAGVILAGVRNMVVMTISVAGIASLASGVCCVLMSLLLGEYRAKMTMLLYPPVQPMYSNMPPYTNVPPQQPGGPQGPNP